MVEQSRLAGTFPGFHAESSKKPRCPPGHHCFHSLALTPCLQPLRRRQRREYPQHCGGRGQQHTWRHEGQRDAVPLRICELRRGWVCLGVQRGLWAPPGQERVVRSEENETRSAGGEELTACRVWTLQFDGGGEGRQGRPMAHRHGR